MKQPERKRRLKLEQLFSYAMFTLLAVVLGLTVFSMQYVVYQPGLVENVRPMIETKQPLTEEKGALMLTTVRMSHMNVFHFARALFDPYMDIEKKADIFREGESREEYMQRQSVNMISSQSNAITAAYNALGIDYDIPDVGVVVMYLFEGMPAEEVLQVGDLIKKVEQTEVRNVEDILQELEGKKAGDQVSLTIERNQELRTLSVELALLPAEEGEASRPGFGVHLSTLQTVEPRDPDDYIGIKADEIGGPSAGLMFALEIYNLLSQEDITRGYRVAGTGSIDPEGNVGVIGGIEHKVVASHRAEADIFFAPKDWVPEEESGYLPVRNTTDAKAVAQKLNTDMRIVSVGSLKEALAYLETLEPKSS